MSLLKMKLYKKKKQPANNHDIYLQSFSRFVGHVAMSSKGLFITGRNDQ